MSINGREPWAANADLSTHQYKFVVNSITNVDRAATLGEATIGTLWNKPESGEDATVTVIGPSKMVAGATIVGGAQITTTASATAITATSGTYVVGRAFTSAASGNLFDGYLTHDGWKGL